MNVIEDINALLHIFTAIVKTITLNHSSYLNLDFPLVFSLLIFTVMLKLNLCYVKTEFISIH